LKMVSHKLDTCLFNLFISSQAFTIVGVHLSNTHEVFRTDSTMCSKFLHCCSNPSSRMVALTWLARARAWQPFYQFNNMLTCLFYLKSMTNPSRTSLTLSMRSIMRKLHVNLVSGGTFNGNVNKQW
jgi:hypothetical protein